MVLRSARDRLEILDELLERVIQESASSELDGRVGAAAPLRPRAVIDRDLLVPDYVKPEGQDRSRHPRAAGGRHRLARIEPRLAKDLLEPLEREERAVWPVQHVIGQVEAARDMARAKPLAGPGPGAVEAAGGAAVRHLLRPGPVVPSNRLVPRPEARPGLGAEAT